MRPAPPPWEAARGRRGGRGTPHRPPGRGTAPQGPTCARCRRPADATILSMFNTEEICLDCQEREEQHPRYEEARRAEAEAVRRGELNFPGVGKPEDL